MQVIAPWEMHSLDPSRTGFLFTRMQVSETLLNIDDSGRPTPGLASAWRVSPDRLTWRFTLRRGARFHDGTPVTPAIVAADLERARAQPGVMSYAAVTGIAADGGDVVIRLSTPSALLPAILAQFGTQILAPASFDAAGAVTRVVGTGPYRITAINKQGFAVALAQSWTGPRPDVTRARYVVVTRDEARAVMAESGQGDVLIRFSPLSLKRLRQDRRLTVLTGMLPRTTTLLLDAGNPLFADPRARRALSVAIDREAIARIIVGDPGYAATQLFAPIMAGWNDAALPPLSHDPARAAAILRRLGWRAGPDGILTRDGRRFEVTLLTYSDRPELSIIATALQAQLRAIGIATTVDIGDNAEVPARHKAGTLQLALAARTYVNIPDPAGTLLQDFAPGGGDWGPLRWTDPRLTAALHQLATGVAPDLAVRLKREVATTLQSELPVIPVMWYQQTAVAGPRITNLSLDPYERSYRLTDIRWRRP